MAKPDALRKGKTTIDAGDRRVVDAQDSLASRIVGPGRYEVYIIPVEIRILETLDEGSEAGSDRGSMSGFTVMMVRILAVVGRWDSCWRDRDGEVLMCAGIYKREAPFHRGWVYTIQSQFDSVDEADLLLLIEGGGSEGWDVRMGNGDINCDVEVSLDIYSPRHHIESSS